MDKLEQKLRKYNENNPVQISEAFLEKLMALEPRPAAEKPRRRYVLPIAATTALALAIGGWFAWRHAAMPEPAPVAIQSAPANVADDPAEPSRPAAKPQPETAERNPQSPAAHVSEEAVPQKDPAAPQKSDNPASAKAEETAPEKTDDTTPSEPEDAPAAKPEDTAPAKPDDTTPAKPDDTAPTKPDDETPGTPAVDPPAKPDDEQPGTPDDPTPAEPDDPPPDDTKPANDPPQIPPYVSPYGAVYQMRDGSETLTVTRLATGESVEIDVTGWMEQAIANAISAGEHAQQPGNPPENDGTGSGACIAFGTLIMYNLKLEADRTVSAEAFDPKEYAQYYAQYHQERENNDET